jgi:hypothetical protein
MMDAMIQFLRFFCCAAAFALALTAARAAHAAGPVVLQLDGPDKLGGKVTAGGVEVSLIYNGLKHDKRLGRKPNGRYTPVAHIRVPASGKRGFNIWAEKSSLTWPSALIQIVELDKSNPYPEVLMATYSGGAHCCNVIKIATSSKDGKGWRIVDGGQYDGEPKGAEDKDKDGLYEIVQPDNRFLYQFSSYAGSFPPLRIWRLKDAKLVDVSRQPSFRALHEDWLKDIEIYIREFAVKYERNGVLAGLVATSTLLGQGQKAWARMLEFHDKRAVWGLRVCTGGYDDKSQCKKFTTYKSYPEALKAFLDKAGYKF